MDNIQYWYTVHSLLWFFFYLDLDVCVCIFICLWKPLFCSQRTYCYLFTATDKSSDNLRIFYIMHVHSYFIYTHKNSPSIASIGIQGYPNCCSYINLKVPLYCSLSPQMLWRDLSGFQLQLEPFLLILGLKEGTVLFVPPPLSFLY